MKRELLEERLVEEIEKLVGGATVSINNRPRNNGAVLTGVLIQEPGTKICPHIHIDDMLDALEEERIDLDVVARQIVDVYEHAKNEMPDFPIGEFNKKSCLEHARIQMVNTEKNKEMLKNIPHKEFLDLSAIYRYVIGKDEKGISSFVISNDYLKALGLELEELDEAARKNTYEEGLRAISMSDVLRERIGGAIDDSIFNLVPVPMYVMSNKENINGANIMLYQEYFDMLANDLNDDLYILPSSIHEVLAVPASKIEPNELRQMVKEINAEEVKAEEILGENVYRWSKDKHQFSIVVGTIVNGNFGNR